MAEKTLYLIDGHSLLYRSYYAIRNLSTSSGFPTNAIYGFVNALRKIRDEAKPSHFGIVFDAPGRKARHELYEAYKAQRKPMPEDLAVQIPKLREVIKTLRIPVIVNEKYEADDVLASLARRAGRMGFKTVVVTTDKDLLQIVDDQVSVYNPAKDIILDPAKVKETFGVHPDQVVDLLSLQGDASDNIPGVPGIGEKTAKDLIEECGSLDGLLKNLDKLKNPRVRDKILANMDKLEMSRKLVVIERDLDVPFDPEEFEAGEPDAAAAARLFEELEFTALSAEYAGKAPAAPRNYTTLTGRGRSQGPGRADEKSRRGLDRHRDDRHLADPGPPGGDVVRPRARRSVLSPPPPRIPGRPAADTDRKGLRRSSGPSSRTRRSGRPARTSSTTSSSSSAKASPSAASTSTR